MRITKEVKAIADAHIAAKLAKNFDDVEVSTKEEVVKLLHEGKTFSKVLEQVEINFCSIGALLMSSPDLLQVVTNHYKAGVYKGFKSLLQTN
jgi:D-serine deaminase-like pyridoxal phosphate-dependent protein